MTRVTGVIAAAATPLTEKGGIDLDKLVEHCGRLLRIGCDGINLLGTTGEATSFSVEQRAEAMAAVAKSGLPLDRFLVGTGAAALADAARLTARARELGFAGALLLPPFYYKGIDHDGLVAYVESLIAVVGRSGLKLYLYNFPQNSGVPYAIEVVGRLLEKNADVVLGLKDSSGDAAYAATLAERFKGFDVFPSAEGGLADAKAKGFAGCISATLNVTAPIVGKAWREGDTALLAEATKIRNTLGSVTLISGVKWALGDLLGDTSWEPPVPPLRALTAAEKSALAEKLAATRYQDLKPVFAEKAAA